MAWFRFIGKSTSKAGVSWNSLVWLACSSHHLSTTHRGRLVWGAPCCYTMNHQGDYQLLWFSGTSPRQQCWNVKSCPYRVMVIVMDTEGHDSLFHLLTVSASSLCAWQLAVCIPLWKYKLLESTSKNVPHICFLKEN